MNAQEKEAAIKVSRIFKCARLACGRGQSELANALSTTQPTISKIENGTLLPSSLMWLQLCNELNIDPGSLFIGYIDNKSNVQRRTESLENGFKLPKKYEYDRYSKIRDLNPLIRHANNALGTDNLHNLLENLEIDPYFIYNHDNQINFNFHLDFAEALLKTGKISKSTFPHLCDDIGSENIQGALYANYKTIKDADKRILSLVSNQIKYQDNFSFEVQHQKENRIDLSIVPQKHLKNFDYLDNELSKDLFCNHKKNYIKSFALYESKQQEVTITEEECLFQGANRCLYRLSIN